MKNVNELVSGFRRFQKHYFSEDRGLYERLTRQGQSPKVMIVACCDSRVDPAIITDSDPGDLFVVRNVANLIPPCELGGGYHGTSAALEFAVSALHVSQLIVMGHARCGGIRALLEEAQDNPRPSGFIAPWMSIVAEARNEVRAAYSGAAAEARERACEQAAIRISLRNLMGFPFVREAVEAGQLTLHGWYFDIERGELLCHSPITGAFEVTVARL
ncbi:MAG: carbonic anhydrase [Gammaproteobacteria bacterium]|nr:carbonic anhydrase [Gammaproteobacteria bacterium]